MSRRRKNTTPSPLTLSAYVMGILAGTGLLAYLAFATLDDPVANKLGCYAEGPHSEVVVAIDVSPPRWNAEQQRAIYRFLSEVHENLRFNERLSIFTTEGDAYAALLTPQVQVCGSANQAEDLESIGVAAPTAGYLVKERTRRFEKLVKPELDTILALEAEPSRTQEYQSPVLEMLQSLSRRHEFRYARRLIVVSDFLQNSETARFCTVQNDMPRFGEFAKRRIYQRVAPESFDGIDIDFLMLQRAGYGGPSLPYCRDEEELQDFFYDYAEGNDARSVRLTRLRHGFGEG